MTDHVRMTVSGRDDERCALTRLYCGPQTQHSYHHRVLRSQGGVDNPETLVLLQGTGTTGVHGWVHAHPASARLLGYLVPSWGDPAVWPVWRYDGLGRRGWCRQLPDGYLERVPVDAVVRFHSTGADATKAGDALVGAIGEARALVARLGGDFVD
ncbi:hypothetical protein [Pseudoclavibacter sp. 13-3]|uniref:hypothetical protein n=1 Tax=Pseudoclavibacter sp. 13-3 TaxID=2901228 RepID=UPI001E5D0CBF|nr:hypothetical protein [Pseudoclavibacter sp. 13-3]MCD7100463.1 hypothetical protein [Pseudoclavibacter sp. 13-3]